MNCCSGPPAPQPLSADIVRRRALPKAHPAMPPDSACRIARADTPDSPANRRSSVASETSHPTDSWKPPWNTPKNVLPFRPDRRAEIAGPDAGGKQRLQRTRPAIIGPARQRVRPTNAGRPKQPRRPLRLSIRRPCRKRPNRPSANNRAGWRDRSRRRAAKPGATGRCSICLPVGVLIYRLDRLLYANRRFSSGSAMPACTRWRKPAGSTRSMSSPAFHPPAAPRTPARR